MWEGEKKRGERWRRREDEMGEGEKMKWGKERRKIGEEKERVRIMRGNSSHKA